MALPKRRQSRSRRDKRRTHWKARIPALSLCSHCSQPKMPHRICPNCGHYDGREVVAPKER